MLRGPVQASASGSSNPPGPGQPFNLSSAAGNRRKKTEEVWGRVGRPGRLMATSVLLLLLLMDKFHRFELRTNEFAFMLLVEEGTVVHSTWCTRCGRGAAIHPGSGCHQPRPPGRCISPQTLDERTD